MVTRKDYSQDTLRACESVLVELVHMLGEYRDQIVVVGGYVPFLLLSDAKERHAGTIDIDLALDFISDRAFYGSK